MWMSHFALPAIDVRTFMKDGRTHPAEYQFVAAAWRLTESGRSAVRRPKISGCWCYQAPRRYSRETLARSWCILVALKICRLTKKPVCFSANFCKVRLCHCSIRVCRGCRT